MTARAAWRQRAMVPGGTQFAGGRSGGVKGSARVAMLARLGAARTAASVGARGNVGCRATPEGAWPGQAMPLQHVPSHMRCAMPAASELSCFSACVMPCALCVAPWALLIMLCTSDDRCCIFVAVAIAPCDGYWCTALAEVAPWHGWTIAHADVTPLNTSVRASNKRSAVAGMGEHRPTFSQA